MRRIALYFFMMALAVFSLKAQPTNEIVKQKVDEGLRTYIKRIYPPKDCKLNGFAHFYTNEMKFLKNQTVGNTLRLWGQARVTYRNARTGGNTYVEFYAEMVKVKGEIELDKLKWRVGNCMKFETLYERESG